MSDNTLRIGAEVNVAELQAGMQAGAAATREAIDSMLTSFQEASTGTARAVSRITEDTKLAATTVSAEWRRAAVATLEYSAAQKEMSAATYLARKAGADDAAATNLLAAAKQRAAAATLELREAEQALAPAEEKVGLLHGAFTQLLGPLIGLEILRRRLEDAAKFGLEMRNLSVVTGLSAATLAGFHDVVKEMGGDFGAVEVALGKLAKAQQQALEGNTKAVDGFTRLGISVKELRGLSPDELLTRVARGFQETGSTAEKQVAGTELLGKGWRTIAEAMTLLGPKFKEYIDDAAKASGVTNETIESAQTFNTITERMGVQLRALAGELLGPMLVVFAEIGSGFEALGNVVINITDLIGAFIVSTLQGVGGIAKVLYDVSSGNFAAAAADAIDTKDKIVTQFTGAWKDVKTSWQEVWEGMRHPLGGIDNPLPALPKLGGEDEPGATGPENMLKKGGEGEAERRQRAQIEFIHERAKAAKKAADEEEKADYARAEADAAVGKAMRDENDKLVATNTETALKLQQIHFESVTRRADYELSQGRITAAQALQIKLNALAEELKFEEQALRIRIANLAPQEVVERQRLENQITLLHAEGEQRRAQLTQQSLTRMQKPYTEFFNRVSEGFKTAMNGWLQGTQSFSRGLEGIWNSLVSSYIQSLAKMLVATLQHNLAKLVSHTATNTLLVASDTAAAAASTNVSAIAALKQILHQAKTAAAHAFKSVMQAVPFPLNVVLAPAAAAGVFAGVAALAAFHGGGLADVEQLAILRKDEMVLDPALSAGFQRMLGAGAGGGGQHFSFGDINYAQHNYQPSSSGAGAAQIAKVVQRNLTRKLRSL